MAETFRFAPPYELPRWPFVAPPDLGAGERIRYPVVIAGGGLAGLVLACDLGQRGIQAVLLDDDDTVGVKGASSRGICYAQKSLELFDRLGIWPRIREKGVTWSVGRTMSGADEVDRFDLADTSRSEQPPFVNLQQFHLEWFLVDRILADGVADLRWSSRVLAVENREDHAVVEVETPAGRYALEAEWLVDATGSNSPIRNAMGLDIHASKSVDRWCISDVRFAQPPAMERKTWVDAPFNEGRAVWQHLMADDVWRLDYQMSPDADLESISRPEVVGARLREQLGPGVDFEFVWIGPYQYRDHLLESFRAGRTLFVGDAAHVVCPFGARGGNNGIQDSANLGWKLALVLAGEAGEALVDSYDHERHAAAVENLKVAARTARFLAPRTAEEHRVRRAVVDLARHHAFARKHIDTGRMAVANDYPPSALCPTGARSVQNIAFDGTALVRVLAEGGGTRLLGLVVARDPAGALAALAPLAARHPIRLHAIEPGGPLVAHLEAAEGAFVLVRPDAYVAATLADALDAAAVERAVRAALALDGSDTGDA